ncbi:hypothetical protein HK102_007140 [Quaeritorhiza haematococci]|nr:hypothetical protein HK102_007140 [Quaeritorhiza haematococci]
MELPMVEVLIRRGVVDFDANYGEYADTYEILRQAIELGDRDLVEFLLQRRVRPDGWDEWDFESRPELGGIALVNGDVEIYKTLVHVGGYDVSQTGKWFWRAIFRNDPMMLKAVLDVGLTDFGRNPEVLSILADAGLLDLDDPTYTNYNTLLKAVHFHNYDAVALLLMNGVSARIDSGPEADVNDVGLFALRREGIDMYRMLVDLGGYPPLRIRMWFDHAIKTDDKWLLLSILGNGITAEDLMGENEDVVDEAAKTREPTAEEKAFLLRTVPNLFPRVAKQLVRVFGCPEELITKIAELGNQDILKVLLDVKGNEAGLGGRTTPGKPLLSAIESCRYHAVHILLKRSYQTAKRIPEPEVLIAAVTKKHPLLPRSVNAEIVKLLLDAGADRYLSFVNDKDGDNADGNMQEIRRAIVSKAINHEEDHILDILVKAGLDWKGNKFG